MQNQSQQSNQPEGENQPKRKSNAAKHKPGLLSFNTCVKTLSNVTISRRGLLNLELSVGLAVFLDAGIANRGSKNMLSEIYQKAGYDCGSSTGKDYKTVNRRIQTSAGLFGKLGLEVINHWASDHKESALLKGFAHELAGMNFNSLDDVNDYVGRTSNRTPGKGGKEKPKSVFDIDLDGVVIRIPKVLTEAQLVELASRIMTLAEEVGRVALEARSAPSGGPVGLEDKKGGGRAKERRKGSVPVEVEKRLH